MALLIVATALINVSFFINSDTLDREWGVGKLSVIHGNIQAQADYYAVPSSQETADYASEVCEDITDEGIVLLKNDGVLPLQKGTQVAPFGFRYLKPVYSGKGSGEKQSGACSPSQGLGQYFTVSERAENALKNASLRQISADGVANIPYSAGDDFEEDIQSVYEFDAAAYSGEKTSSVAIVFLGRMGNESGNFGTAELADGTAHCLALTEAEKQTVAAAKKSCESVIAVINSSNVMEIGELMSGELECDAVLWLGGAGATGFLSLARILCGEVNPSGRTADIWASDLLSAPSMRNFGSVRYTNSMGIVISSNCDGSSFPAGLYYIEYEEGIYIGYRYYETAAAEGALEYGATDSQGRKISEGAVNYPFGYGLSYTQFTQRIAETDVSGGKISVTAEVSNTGRMDGAEVVQIYITAPYTVADKQSGTEKSFKQLVAFGKVYVKAGESQRITLTFRTEDMASYSYSHNNGDGTRGCYVLESGDYTVWLGKNSHDVWDERTVNIPHTVFYSGSNVRQSDRLAQPQGEEVVSVFNRFEDGTAYMFEDGMQNLSRADMVGTMPESTEAKNISDVRLVRATHYDPFTDIYTGNVEGSRIYAEDFENGAETGLKLSDMRGKEYDSPLWEEFLSGVDYSSEEVEKLLLMASFHTSELEEIGKPRSYDTDGPQGLSWKREEDATFTYCGENVVAATFNTELALCMGRAVGKEALRLGISGWYAPGLNMHRTPFQGRNFEYYSEDPYLSGKLGAAVVSGAAESGLVTYVKHFAACNYDGPTTSLSVWATEQTLREIYLKSFEIVVKEASAQLKYFDEGQIKIKKVRACTGIMGAANMIGTEWCSANYVLLNDILRGEWGFNGSVISDMMLQNSYGITDKMFRNGCDLRMFYTKSRLIDGSSPTMLAQKRRALKNICYTYANSNLLNGIAPGSTVKYGMSPWKIWLIAADVAVLVIEVGLLVFLVVRKKLYV